MAAVDYLSRVPSLSEPATMVAAHHECWDGTGYPLGLAGLAIPLAARVFAIADSIVAMRSEHPHRTRMAWDDVFSELSQGAGSQWDPDLSASVLNGLDWIAALDDGCPPQHWAPEPALDRRLDRRRRAA